MVILFFKTSSLTQYLSFLDCNRLKRGILHTILHTACEGGSIELDKDNKGLIEGADLTNFLNPFTTKPPVEVHLPHAPLVNVIAQLRFPTIASIENPTFIGAFQEDLRSVYPLLQADKNVLISSSPHESHRIETVWRFVDGAQKWRISLAPNFISIETISYISRKDFLGRFKQVLDALHKHIKPHFFDRLGLRYIDQITGENLDRIGELVQPAALDFVGTPLREYIAHSLNQTLYILDENKKFSSRCGMLEANITYDPASLPAINEKSWILDLDVYSEVRAEFSPDKIMKLSHEYTNILYSFFRWVVTPAFLEAYGGQINDE